jgi:DASH complex subunit DAD1
LIGWQVGNEFSSVEALWSQFENVMAKDPDAEGEGQHTGEEGEEHGDEETEIHEGNGRSR